jgi:V/A-type H+-transporting ATPase subunit K
MFDTFAQLTTILTQNGGSMPAITPKAAAALAVGLAALGAGYAERGIGSAAVGAIAEDQDLFGTGLILTVLPETLVILALVVIFVVPSAF